MSEEAVETGRWDDGAFAAGAAPPNTVRVTARRTTGNGNAVDTIVMGILGRPTADVTAISIALLDADEGGRARFLIDDEMIDTDIPAIEDLADDLGKSPEDIAPRLRARLVS